MATRGDVVKERRRYKLIRRVLGGIFLISTLGWVVYFAYGMYAAWGERDLWTTFVTLVKAFGWGLISVSWMPAQDMQEILKIFSYMFYTSLVSGLLLYYYLKHRASFKCPYCRRVIDLNITWECPSCHHVKGNPFWYTIFHKCNWSKCRESPEAFACPRCGNTIYLLSPAPQLRSLPASDTPPVMPSNVARFPGTGS